MDGVETRLVVNEHNERCKRLANAVEHLSQTEMEELFRMIHQHNCEYSKNNNGIFVNLAWINSELLNQLEQYVMFCSKSGIELKKYESLCDVLNTRMQHDKSTVLKTKVSTDFKKDDKGGSTGTIGAADVEECDVEEKINSKISSSMRFSLLKKKLAKISIQNTSYENDLKQDAFVL